MGPVLSEYRYLVNRPREQIHDLLDKMTDDYPFSEQEAARILKEYLAGYVRTIKLVMDLTDRKVLVKRADYAEWRIRHRELLRLRDELRKDKRLEAIETILGCTELPELRAILRRRHRPFQAWKWNSLVKSHRLTSDCL